MNVTSIEWTATEMPDGTMRPGFSANPLKYRRKSDGRVVWGCVKVSPGCALCYSEALALRFSRGRLFNAKNMEELEPFLDEKELKQIRSANIVSKVPVDGSKCFLGDMTDIFGEWVTEDMLSAIFATMLCRPNLTFQILTKRPERMAEFMNATYVPGSVLVHLDELEGSAIADWQTWPPTNIHLGTSVENQEQANNRLSHLLKTQAAVRFVSYEPALGPVKLFDKGCPYPIHTPIGERVGNGLLDWVIIGGESGHGARPSHINWFRSMVEQCRDSGTRVFVKQLGKHYYQQDSPAAEKSHCLSPDQKGGNMDHWPHDLRVRQFPKTERTA